MDETISLIITCHYTLVLNKNEVGDATIVSIVMQKNEQIGYIFVNQ
jgi:hypothetical protein